MSGWLWQAVKNNFVLKKVHYNFIFCLLFFVQYGIIILVGDAGVSEWQTRQTQNLLWATTYGFKSHCRHRKICKVKTLQIFFYSASKSSSSNAKKGTYLYQPILKEIFPSRSTKAVTSLNPPVRKHSLNRQGRKK